eukprot:m.103491 g.103491  ORF g.103491 m.103491 type:complete len:145 (+) comp27502_c0_seq4:334-768(+)
MAATTNVGELLKQRDTSGDVVADVHNVIQCLTDHSMAVVRIHKPEIAAQVTQLLFKVAKQMATKSELHILLVTPSSAWLDACVTDMNVADVTGLSKLEIKYTHTNRHDRTTQRQPHHTTPRIIQVSECFVCSFPLIVTYNKCLI